MLPPCQENLKLHMTRANYVATIFNRANMLLMSLDSPLQHGWGENLSPLWYDIVFPNDLSEMLFNIDEDELSEDESDDERVNENVENDSNESEESEIDF